MKHDWRLDLTQEADKSRLTNGVMHDRQQSQECEINKTLTDIFTWLYY